MARMAASCTLSGAGKSGWPMQKLMMSLPWRASAFTSARTTKAFSVPSDFARRLISGMGRLLPEKRLFYWAVAAGLELQAADAAAEVWQLVARVAGQRNVGAALFLPDLGQHHRRDAAGGHGERLFDAPVFGEHVQALRR